MMYFYLDAYLNLHYQFPVLINAIYKFIYCSEFIVVNLVVSLQNLLSSESKDGNFGECRNFGKLRILGEFGESS